MKYIYHLIFSFIVIISVSCAGVNKKSEISEVDKLFQTGEIDLARLEIEKILEKSPLNEYAWTLKGHIEESTDNDSIAELSYLEALEINSEMAEALTGIGILYRKKREYDKAIEYYEKALLVNPEYAQAYSSILVIELKRKKFDSAIINGLKAYELDETDPAISANLAVAYHYKQDTLNRDKYFDICKKLGYSNVAILDKIFSGELTIFD